MKFYFDKLRHNSIGNNLQVTYRLGNQLNTHKYTIINSVVKLFSRQRVLLRNFILFLIFTDADTHLYYIPLTLLSREGAHVRSNLGNKLDNQLIWPYTSTTLKSIRLEIVSIGKPLYRSPFTYYHNECPVNPILKLTRTPALLISHSHS